MTTLAKQRIKKVFEGVMDNVDKGKAPNISGEMRKNGYSESSCRALQVQQTKAWQKLLSTVKDDKILKRLSNIVDKGSDKDAISASRELLKLKNRYPKNKTGSITFKRKIEDLYE